MSRTVAPVVVEFLVLVGRGVYVVLNSSDQTHPISESADLALIHGRHMLRCFCVITLHH